MDKKLILALLLLAAVALVGLLVVSAQITPTVDDTSVGDAATTQTYVPGTSDIINTSINNVSLNLFRTYQNASYVAAGIGVRNTGRGTISLRLPYNTSLIDAWLYWKILNSTAGIHDNEITVNGIRVRGMQIGSGPAPCWPNYISPTTGIAYRANITSVIQSTDDGISSGFDIGGMSTLITDGRPSWNESFSWEAFNLPAAEDVGLIIVFSSPPTQNFTNTVTIFDGYSEHNGGTVMFQVPEGTNRYSSIIGDGQVIGVQPYIKSVSFKDRPGVVSLNLQNVTLNGIAPSITSESTYQGSLSDIDTFTLPAIALPGATLTWKLANDCVAYDALVFQGQVNNTNNTNGTQTNVTPTVTNTTSIPVP